jgi:hypothetical protein
LLFVGRTYMKVVVDNLLEGNEDFGRSGQKSGLSRAATARLPQNS